MTHDQHNGKNNWSMTPFDNCILLNATDKAQCIVPVILMLEVISYECTATPYNNSNYMITPTLQTRKKPRELSTEYKE